PLSPPSPVEALTSGWLGGTGVGDGATGVAVRVGSSGISGGAGEAVGVGVGGCTMTSGDSRNETLSKYTEKVSSMLELFGTGSFSAVARTRTEWAPTGAISENLNVSHS